MGEIQTVEVEAKNGRCIIDFERTRPGVWSIHLADELIAEAPEALAQALYSGIRKLAVTVVGVRLCAPPYVLIETEPRL